MKFARHIRWGSVLIALALFLLIPGRSILAQESVEAGNRQYRAAAELQRSGQFQLAVPAWTDFLSKNKNHPHFPQAKLNLGICYLKSKQYDKAMETLTQVLKDYPESPFRDAAYLYLGATQFSLGRAGQREQYGEAMKTFDKLLREYPRGRYLPQTLYYRAECAYALGNKEGAAKLYERLVREFPKSGLLSDALYALGVTQEELGQFHAAGATYDQFLKTSPKNPLAVEVVMRRGETLFGIGQYKAAAEWFARAGSVQNFRLADHALMRQAASLTQLKEYNEAADLYRSIVNKFPNSTHVEAANLAAGKCYYLAGDWAQSIKVLSKVIAARGKSLPEATHWSARSLLKEKKPKEAVALLEKTLSESGGSPMEAQLRMDLADATYEIPKLRNISVTLYEDVAKQFPEDVVADSALYMAAFASLQLGNYEAAIGFTDQFIEKYSASNLLPDVVAVAAESDLQLGHLEDAERRYYELTNRYPNHPDFATWRLRRGLVLYMQEKYVQAVGVIKPIVGRLRSKTAQAEAYYLIGSSLIQRKKFDEGMASLESSIMADPNWRQADDTLLMLADALRQKGDQKKAEQIINRLITSFPKSSLLDQAHYWLAEMAYGEGNMAAAASGYQTVVQSWPKSQLMPHALFGLGWAQLSQENYAEAEKTFDRLVTQFPEHSLISQARFARGTARQQLGKFAAAAEDVESLLAGNPSGKEKSDARYVLGLCQSGLKKHDEAIATFRSLLEDDPNYAGADKTRYELAWALRASGQMKEAADEFLQLAERYPTSPLAAESVFHAADVQYDQKHYDEAAAIYTDVARKTSDPFLKEKALHKIAWIWFNRGEFEKARQAFADQRKAVAQGKLVADAMFMEGQCLMEQGKFKEALAAFEQMMASPIKPLGEDFEALAHMRAAQAAARLKEPEKSLAYLKQAVERDPKSHYLPEILFEQARLQEKLGHPDEAAKLYAAVPEKTNREVAAKAQYRLGQMLVAQNKPTEAVRVFYEVIYGGYKFPQWQADATFEAARCFETLKKKDQAEKLYRELLEKYPKSDKAAEAKKRLDSLGNSVS